MPRGYYFPTTLNFLTRSRSPATARYAGVKEVGKNIHADMRDVVKQTQTDVINGLVSS